MIQKDQDTLEDQDPLEDLQDSNEEAVIPIQQNLDEVETEIILINEPQPDLFCETKEMDGQSEFVTWTTKIWDTQDVIVKSKDKRNTLPLLSCTWFLKLWTFFPSVNYYCLCSLQKFKLGKKSSSFKLENVKYQVQIDKGSDLSNKQAGANNV